MLKKTNLEAILEKAKKFVDVVEIKPDEKYPFICSHPFTTSIFVYGKDGNLCDLSKEEDYLRWRKGLFRYIDECKSVEDIFCFLNTSWYLTFLKFTKDNMSLEDFSRAFGKAWVAQEDPNGDKNVPIRTSASWFKRADKKELMTKKDYEKWSTFETGLVVYRGVAVGRKPKGLSWTTSLEKAEWFAHRFDTDQEEGYVEKIVVSDKKNILCYFSTRDEEEVVIDTFSERGIEIIK